MRWARSWTYIGRIPSHLLVFFFSSPPCGLRSAWYNRSLESMDQFLSCFLVCWAVSSFFLRGCADGSGVLARLPRSACCTFSSTSCGLCGAWYRLRLLEQSCWYPFTLLVFLLRLWPRSLSGDYFFGGFLVGAVRLGLWRTPSLLGAFVHVMLCF